MCQNDYKYEIFVLQEAPYLANYWFCILLIPDIGQAAAINDVMYLYPIA
jgi:fumarate reductase subunit C